MRHSWVLAVLATLALAGCETTSDPGRGGFISGLRNLSDGTYDRRLAEQQVAVEDAQDANLRKQRELERVRAQSADAASRRSEAEGRLASLQADLDAMKAKLAAGRTQNAALQREIDALGRRIAMAEADPTTDEAEKTRRLAQLRSEKEALEKQVDLAISR